MKVLPKSTIFICIISGSFYSYKAATCCFFTLSGLCFFALLIKLTKMRTFPSFLKAAELEIEAYPLLDELTSKISTLNLERVRRLKSRLVALTRRVQKVVQDLPIFLLPISQEEKSGI